MLIIFMIILGQIPVLLTLDFDNTDTSDLESEVLALKSKHQDSAYSADIDDFKRLKNTKNVRNKHKY